MHFKYLLTVLVDGFIAVIQWDIFNHAFFKICANTSNSPPIRIASVATH